MLLSAAIYFLLCHYAECRYAECRSAECSGAQISAIILLPNHFEQPFSKNVWTL